MSGQHVLRKAENLEKCPRWYTAKIKNKNREDKERTVGEQPQWGWWWVLIEQQRADREARSHRWGQRQIHVGSLECHFKGKDHLSGMWEDPWKGPCTRWTLETLKKASPSWPLACACSCPTHHLWHLTWWWRSTLGLWSVSAGRDYISYFTEFLIASQLKIKSSSNRGGFLYSPHYTPWL